MEVDKKSPLLAKIKSKKFHSIVMKLFWVCKQSQLDIETTLSFLCTCTHKSNEQDWNKLHHILEYVHHTIDDWCTISASTLLGTISTCVDVSYMTHDYMRSHT